MKCIKFLLLGLILGCSPKYANIGWEYFYTKDFKNSNYYFSESLKKDSLNYDSIKGIGLSYLMLDDYDKAEKYINKAFSMNNTDPENSFILGLYYSSKSEPEKSVYFLEKYVELGKNEELKNDANKIITSEKKKIFAKDFKTFIENESKISSVNVTDNSVAVLPFRNVGEHGDYDILERGLAEQTITYLGYINKLKVLERLRVEELNKEITLSGSQITNKSAAVRAGKFLKAEKLISGDYNVTKDNNLTINMYSISMKDGSVNDKISETGKLDNFFEIHKETVLKAIDRMKISIDDETRKKILTYKTENLLEFMSFLKKKYFEESESVIISSWITGKIESINHSPVFDVMNVSQINVKPEIKPTTLPIESPDLSEPPALPK